MSGEQPEVADELVEPEKKIGEIVAISPEFEGFKAGLLEMFRQAHNVTFDLTTTKGSDGARRLRKQLVTSRVAIESTRVDMNRQDRQSIADRITRRDEGAKLLIAMVEDLEEPLDEQIRADEARREREKEEARQREAGRIAALRQRVDDITSVAVRAAGRPSAEIQEKLELVSRVTVDDTFEEFQATAANAKADTIVKLTELLTAAKQTEAERAEAERNRAELDRLRREDEQRQAQARQREEQERLQRAREEQERQRVAAAAAAERQKQSTAAQACIQEIQRLRKGAMTATAAGLAAIIQSVEAVRPASDCGDFAGLWQQAAEDALEELGELHEQRTTAEAESRRRREEADAQRAATQRTNDLLQEIEGIRHQWMIACTEDKTVAAAEKRLAQTEAIAIDAERFGVLAGAAESTKADAIAKIKARIEQLRSPPPPAPPPPEAPAEPPALQVVAHISLDAAVVAVVKNAKSVRGGATYSVPGKVFLEMCAALTRVELPGGQRWAADGTLMNADGTRSVFDDVDE